MKTKICGIYSIYCLANNRRYIGLSNDIEQRWAYHTSTLRDGSHVNCHMQASWNKYGAESFEFMVLQEVPELLLSILEVAWIKCYDTSNPKHGFNMNEGGDRPTFSAETRAKMSAWQKGRTFSCEHRAKISSAGKGRTHTAESKAKMSAAAKGRKCKPFSAEHIAHMSASQTGRKASDETRAKLSDVAKRRTYSEETRAKFVAAWVARRARRKEA